MNSEVGHDANDKSMRVVARALTVLSLIGSYPNGLTLQEIHDRSEIPLASLHRILSTLVAERFAFKAAGNRRYFLGERASDLARSRNFGSFVVPPPLALTDAAERSGETVFLTQLIEHRIVCVSLVEARHSLRLTVSIGESVPLDTAASARVVLAHLNSDLRQRVLRADQRLAAAPDATERLARLEHHLALVQERGFDFCAGELDEGVWAVAAPIFDANGDISLGITLAAAATRMAKSEAKARALEIILSAAEVLSRQNGFAVPIRPEQDGAELTRALGQSVNMPDLSMLN